MPASILQLTLVLLLSGAFGFVVEVVPPIESIDGHGYSKGASNAEVVSLTSGAEVVCGISIELYYYGISEPIYHYRGYHMLQKPFNINDDQHVQKSLFMTFLHWGLHGWCPYIVVAISLSLALFPQSCHMHFGHLYNVLVLVLMGFCLYFVTSSISGSYVDNHVSANGHETSPALQNVHWCWTEGLAANALVKAGGDEATKALRTAAFVAFLPCTTAIICFMRTVISRAVVLPSARSLLIVLVTFVFALTSNLERTTGTTSGVVVSCRTTSQRLTASYQSPFQLDLLSPESILWEQGDHSYEWAVLETEERFFAFGKMMETDPTFVAKTCVVDMVVLQVLNKVLGEDVKSLLALDASMPPLLLANTEVIEMLVVKVFTRNTLTWTQGGSKEPNAEFLATEPPLTGLLASSSGCKVETLVVVPEICDVAAIDLNKLHRDCKLKLGKDALCWVPGGFEDTQSDPEECRVLSTSVDVSFKSKFEDFQLKERTLVLTALADRCYNTTSAQAPDPTASGKTETMANLSNTMGLCVAATNCGDQPHSPGDDGQGIHTDLVFLSCCGLFNNESLTPDLPAVTPDLDVVSFSVEFATYSASAYSVLASSSSSLREGGITSTTEFGNPTAVHATTILGAVDQGKLETLGGSDFPGATYCENATPLKTKFKEPPQSVAGSSIALILPPLEFGSRPLTTPPEFEPHPLQWAVLIAEAFALVNCFIAQAFAKADRNKQKWTRMLWCLGRFLMSPKQVQCLLMVLVVFIVPAAAALPRVPVNTAPPKQAHQGTGPSALHLSHAELEKGPLAASSPPVSLSSEASHRGPGVEEAPSLHLEAAALKFAMGKEVDRQRVTIEQTGKGIEHKMRNTMVRTDSTSSTQRDLSTTTSIVDTSTNTKMWYFSDALAPARQIEEPPSSSSLLEPPSRSIVITRRRLATTTVTTEAELTTALDHDVRIELAADIILTSTVAIDGLTGVFIDGKGFYINGNDAVRCFNISNGAEVALSNLTITRGSTTGDGGGLYITNSATVEMHSCTVSENTAQYGGGLFITGSATVVTVTWCTVSKNTASNWGGGLLLLHISSATVELHSCTVVENTASSPYGGGLYINSATVEMYSCTVSENSALHGGGLYIKSATVEMHSCTVLENTAPHGGGLYISSATVELHSCIVSKNTAQFGGGFLITGSARVELHSCTVLENTASTDGGGLYITNSAMVEMYSCTVSENTASTDGGGLYITNSATVEMYSCTVSDNTALFGGGLYISSATVELHLCTVSENTASTNGGGVYISSATLYLVGCTYSGNSASSSGGDIFKSSGSLELYSLCPGSSSYAGTGAFDCSGGCSGPADLSSTSSCEACTAPTPFACCGATACNALALNCTTNEVEICPSPSAIPTLVPTRLPTITTSPTPVPTMSPEPTPRPTPETPTPTPPPSLVPTPVPSPPPSEIPTSTPSTSYLPTSAPTLYCASGTELGSDGLCSDCSKGQYSDRGKDTQAPWSCERCPVGKFQSAEKATMCMECPVGLISDSSRRFCTQCSPGQFVAADLSCVICPTGTFAPTSLVDACLSCAVGSKTDLTTGATSCTACDSGKSRALNQSAGTCQVCTVGSYSGASAESCSFCGPGKFSEAAGSSECSDCPLGRVASGKGASSCQSCRAGQFQDAPGQVLCKQCAAGSFSSLEGWASCSNCRGDLYSTAAATECTLCRRLFFYTLEGECAECPAGVDCSLDGGATQELLTLKRGYWRISHLAAEVYPCELTLACKGGSDFDKSTHSRKLRADAQGSNTGYCNEGYTGTLCSICVRNGDEHYFLGTGTESVVKECLPCGDANTFIAVITAPRVIMLFVALFLAVGLLVASFIKFKPSTKAKQQQKKLTDKIARENDTVTENEDGSKAFTKVFEPEGLSTVKRTVSINSSSEAIIVKVTTTRVTSETTISTETTVRESNAFQAFFHIVKMSQVHFKALVAFFQIVGNIGFNYSLTWPALFEAIVDELAVFNIDVMPVLGLNCTFKRFDYIDTMLVTTLLPLALAALLLAAHLFANLQQRSRRKKRAKEGANFELTDELRAVFTIRDIINFREVYATYDIAGSGEIEFNEFTEILKQFYSNLSDAEADHRAGVIIAAADVDGNGSISFSEFVSAMHKARHQGQASAFADLVDKVEAKVTKVAGQTTFYAFLTLTFLVLVGTSSNLFHYFKCRSFPEAEGGEESYLFKDYSIDCDSTRYKVYWVYAGLMLLVYPLGIPLLYAGLLHEHRDVLDNNEAMDREAANGFPTTGHLLFLIEAYKTEYLYFEVMECGRRLLLAAVIGIVAADSAASPAIGLCISLFFVYVFTAWQPYRNSSTNFMGVVLAFSLTFFFIAALMIKADLSSDDKSDQKTYGFVLIAVLFVGPATLVIQLTKSYAIPLWRRLCARKEVVDEEPTERMAETEQDMIETGVFDESTVGTPSGSQGGVRDHEADNSTHKVPQLCSTDGLARAYSGDGSHFELLQMSRSPHAVEGRRYVTADDNDAAISDDDSTELKI